MPPHALLTLEQKAILSAASRIPLSATFFISGVGKLTSIEVTKAYMEAYGVPCSLVYPAAFFEIGVGMTNF